jgi:hypothetical protein
MATALPSPELPHGAVVDPSRATGIGRVANVSVREYDRTVPQGTAVADLLRRHLPVLRYDSQGSFPADSPAILTNRVSPTGEANALKRADGTILATASGGRRRPRLGLEFLGWPGYGDGGAVARSDFLDATGRDYVLQAREMHRGQFADRIYGRAIRRDNGGWWLQYWFFYLYNNKAFLGLGLHEGDWEMVQVQLGSGGRPGAMAFAQHGHGQRCRWEAVERQGERPVVYVARGSQASFPTAGRHDAPVVPDHADGKGALVDNATLEVIDSGSPGWVDWPGRWGSSKGRHMLESNSPRGPAHQEKWAEPEAFHEECDDLDRRPRGPAAPTPVPPRPEISARREGRRGVIAYRFPTAAEQPVPAQLIVTLDSPDDALPPATYTHPVEAPAGEVEHPPKLEEERYEVRATAADDRGNVSQQAISELR